jgi:hypothetical protein
MVGHINRDGDIRPATRPWARSSGCGQVMVQQPSPQFLASFWNPRFPSQIADRLVIAEELAGNVIDLEGHDLVAVPLGHTDTDNTTWPHVPSIGLVIAGDAAYNGVHLHLAESNPHTCRESIAALDACPSLNSLAYGSPLTGQALHQYFTKDQA